MIDNILTEGTSVELKNGLQIGIRGNDGIYSEGMGCIENLIKNVKNLFSDNLVYVGPPSTVYSSDIVKVYNSDNEPIWTRETDFIHDAVHMAKDKALVMAMEELSELSISILNFENGIEDMENLAEEMVDVYITNEWVREYVFMQYREKLNTCECTVDTDINSILLSISKLTQQISKLIRDRADFKKLEYGLNEITKCLEIVKGRYNVKDTDLHRWFEYKKNRITSRIENNTLS